MTAPQRVVVVRCPGLCPPAGAGPGREAARAFERVLAALAAFCPAVEVTEPGACAFGARGPARQAGGETALAGDVAAALADLGVGCRVGIADGLFAAACAARHGGGAVHVVPPGQAAAFLARLPVSELGDRALAGLLRRLGLRTLGDFAALPAGEVAARFGAAGEAAHRLARGRDARPVTARPPDPDLSAARQFGPPEPLAEPVVFAAKALAGQMHAGLAGRGLACVRVRVQITWADGRESSRLWRHEGLLSAVQVADRVRWQLDGAREAGPEREAGGIAVLRLVPDQVIRATGHQLALWGEPAAGDRVARAAMRVQAMLGQHAVLRPLPQGGRNVSEQVTHVPFGERRQPGPAGGREARPWPGRIPGAAPAVVYPEPRQAAVTDAAGRAVTVTGRCAVSAAPATLAIAGEPPRPVAGWAGPWPLSERWWDPAAARRRARFQLLTGDGRAWLAAVQHGRWLIEAGYW